MNLPTTDSLVLGRTARIFDNINFRNGQLNTDGDFTLPDYHDEIFPYCMDPMSIPMGTDANFTVRLRGYFNVPETLAGKTIAFGFNCDDFCSLRIGTTTLMPAANELFSSRVIKQASFSAAGLYPVEMIYYQNGSTAFLEWARTDIEVPECDSCPYSLNDYMSPFKLILGTELYSAKVGSKPDCQECGAIGMDCSPGDYCDAGLCQHCNTSEHCGPACLPCPIAASLCSIDRCVECTADEQCPKAQLCDTPAGTCMVPPCTSTSCDMGQVCELATHQCTPLPTCNLDEQCPADQVCDLATNLCHPGPTRCNFSDCPYPDQQYCDPVDMICKHLTQLPAGNGCSGAPGDQHGEDPNSCMVQLPCPPGSACSNEHYIGPQPVPYPHQRICGCGVLPARRGGPGLPGRLWFLGAFGGLALSRWRRRRPWSSASAKG